MIPAVVKLTQILYSKSFCNIDKYNTKILFIPKLFMEHLIGAEFGRFTSL